eukprot:TRINITY_DN10836_c0_g1_i1.p1 TRINITY_DN10836_c0_g1~~TRINITY_DN10836_c0_g1_i1.p1  ORF type:complete len:707 (-),score=146.15 TRINITY_DN10836_c0_g1_i1:99-2219(-)
MGVIAPLDQYFLRWSRLERFDQTSSFAAPVVTACQFKGVWYASPMSWTTRVLAYRKDVFREVFGHDNPPETLDELYMMATTINETVPNMWGFGAVTAGDDPVTGDIFARIFQTYGGKFYDSRERCKMTANTAKAKGNNTNNRNRNDNDDSNAYVSAMEYWTGFAKDNISPGSKLRAVDARKMFRRPTGQGDPRGKYGNAQLAMVIDHLSHLAADRPDLNGFEDIGLAHIPRQGKEDHHNVIDLEAYSIFESSNHKDEAWEYVKFFSDPGPSGFLTEHTRRSGVASVRIESFGNPAQHGDALLTILPYFAIDLKPPYNASPWTDYLSLQSKAVPQFFPSHNSPAMRFIAEDIPSSVQEVMHGRSPQKVGHQACDRFERKWDEYKAPSPYSTDDTLKDSWTLPLLIVNSILLFLLLAACCFIIHVREYAHIHYASMWFCLLMWLGCALGLVSLYWWILQPPKDWMCYCRMWFAPMAFALVFGALTAKTYRVNVLFNNKTLKLRPIGNVELLRWVLLICVIPIVLSGVWTGVGEPEVKFVNVSDQDKTHFEQCSYSHYWVFMSLYYTYFGLILLVNCWLAFRVRRASYMLNDSKEMVVAIFSVALLACICLPLVHVFHDLPELALSLTVLGAWSAIIVFLSAIFALKFFAILSGGSSHFSQMSHARKKSQSFANTTSQWTITETGGGTANPLQTRRWDDESRMQQQQPQ